MRRVKRVFVDNEYNQVLHGEGSSNPFGGEGHVGVNPLFVPTLPVTSNFGEFVLRAAPQHPFYLMVPEGYSRKVSDPRRWRKQQKEAMEQRIEEETSQVESSRKYAGDSERKTSRLASLCRPEEKVEWGTK